MTPKLFDITDVSATRESIYENLVNAFSKVFPLDTRYYKVHLQNINFPEKRFSLKDQKKALIEDKDLVLPLKGTVSLEDKTTGKIMESKTVTLAHVPYYTERGTFIFAGNEYVVANQVRLRPGVYTRVKDNGELEAHFNLKSERNFAFRLQMDPETGVFSMNVGQAKLKLYPILRAMGVSDEMLSKSWGKDLAEENKTNDFKSVDKLYAHLFGRYADPNLGLSEKAAAITEKLSKTEMEPEINRGTLGQPFGSVSPIVLLTASEKLLKIRKGEEEPSDRDSLKYRTIHGVDDFFAEHVTKDSGRLLANLKYKIDAKKSLAPLGSGYFTPQLRSIIVQDSRSRPLEEINPLEILAARERVVALGEGGIASVEGVPDAARNIHPSSFGFIDPSITPESNSVGVDNRLAYGVMKGNDRKLYTKVLNRKTGQLEYLPADILADSIVAFPGQEGNYLKVFNRGKIDVVPSQMATYQLPSTAQIFSAYANLIPMIGNTQGARLNLGAKSGVQALPLVEGEAPLVRSKVPGEETDFDTVYGKITAGVMATSSGEVTEITEDGITVMTSQGPMTYDLYNKFPFNRATLFTSKPIVKVGDQVKPGMLLAHSNFTDATGALSTGRNLRVGYIMAGANTDDGFILSESGAKKLTSEHLGQNEIYFKDGTEVNKDKFMSLFPTKYTKDQVDKLDADGVVTPGTIVQPGDILMAAVKPRAVTTLDMDLEKMHRMLKRPFDNVSTTYDEDEPGEVVEVSKTDKGVKVFVKTRAPMKVGDKLNSRFGSKGVVSVILPDSQMPRMKETGEPMDLLVSPLSLTTRINPSAVYELLLGKIAQKTGKPYLIESFGKENLNDRVKSELMRHGLSDQEELEDPKTGRTFKAMVGPGFYSKLSKTALSMYSSRDTDSYTSDMLPAKGEGEAKRMGNMEISALVGHGAWDNLRDVMTYKSNKDDDVWRALRLGYPLPTPRVPFIYKKFVGYLQGAGINIDKQGETEYLVPATDKDTISQSQGAVRSGRIFKGADLTPEDGGLFDIAVTGGPSGIKWSHIDLVEKFPSPVMELPLRSLLGVTQKEFENMVGQGGEELEKQLSGMDVDKELVRYEGLIKASRGMGRDKAVKNYKYLQALKSAGLKPVDLLWSKVPVIPPVYRPATLIGDLLVEGDSNLLYRTVLNLNNTLTNLKKDLPSEDLKEERLSLYNSLRSLTGLQDPLGRKERDKGVSGFIQHIVGTSPKQGQFQSKVTSRTQDLVGRAVVVPDPMLNIDQVGLPEDMAWKVYSPFVMRNLVRRGMPAMRAAQEVTERSARAKESLQDAMAERPLLLNRAPTLHKFNIMAFMPTLTDGRAIKVPPPITSSFGMDFDGDAATIHVPISEEARREAIDKLLPSKNLFGLKKRVVHYLPLREANYGLFLASKKREGKPVVFQNEKAVVESYNDNKITFDTPVLIEES